MDAEGNCYIIESASKQWDDKVIKRLGPAGNRTWKVKNFLPRQVGREGTIWGYTYKGIEFGGRPADLSVARLTDAGVEVVHANFRVLGFNSLGDYGGERTGELGPAVAYVKGKLVQVELPKQARGYVAALNDVGDLVGAMWTGMPSVQRAFLHSKGKTTYLPPPHSRSPHFYPAKINSSGVIAGTASPDGKTGVYLYVPKD